MKILADDRRPREFSVARNDKKIAHSIGSKSICAVQLRARAICQRSSGVRTRISKLAAASTIVANARKNLRDRRRVGKPRL